MHKDNLLSIVSRRRMLTGAAALTAALSVSQSGWAKAIAGSKGKAGLKQRPIWIDALGGGSDPTNPNFKSILEASDIAVSNLTISSVGNEPDGFEKTVSTIAQVDDIIHQKSDVVCKILSAGDIVEARDSGKLGLIYGTQDTSMLGSDLGRLDTLKGLGVRVVQLTYNKRNLVGDGCLEKDNAGLSDFGREVVSKLNALNVLIDLSHAGQKTIAQAIAESKTPIAITHTGCRSLVDFPRNTYDAELKALADKGGVAGIYFMPFLRPKGQPRAEDVVRHIEHAINICGEDHIGIGTDGDFDHIELNEEAAKRQREFYEDRAKKGLAAPGEAPDVFNLVLEYNGPHRFHALADDLRKRGHSQARIDKILGGNFFRLMKDVWKA